MDDEQNVLKRNCNHFQLKAAIVDSDPQPPLRKTVTGWQNNAFCMCDDMECMSPPDAVFAS